MDLTRSDKMIVDVVQIYNVANVSGREPESCISICSSADGMKCALLINDYPHAAFTAKRGYCRANLPNLPNAPSGCYDSSDHHWSDDAIAWLRSVRHRTVASA
jgi:hypothetical protein